MRVREMNKYKTKPFEHQKKAIALSADKEYFALLMEQGTGKSWVVVNTAAHLRRAGKIDTVVVIAPKGVAPGWIRQQFPMHCPDDVPYVAALWRPKSDMTRSRQRSIAEVRNAEPECIKVFVMNIEAFGATSEALDFAIDVLDEAQAALLVVDESHRIKTPTAHTTKRILNLRIRAAFRRILTGTVADKPFDVFSQFKFLSPDILQTDSFTAFKSEYAELVPDNSGLMRHIAMRIPKKWSGQYVDDITGQPADGERNEDGTRRKKHMVPAYLPTIVAKNEDGTPRYRNLEQLQQLKKDCLDLPEKLYNRYYTELAPHQQDLYEQIRDQHRIEWESGAISTFSKLTVYLRLQQVLCGYIPAHEDGEPLRNLFDSWQENPRILSAMELI
jgi:hypothetical protein